MKKTGRGESDGDTGATAALSPRTSEAPRGGLLRLLRAQRGAHHVRQLRHVPPALPQPAAHAVERLAVLVDVRVQLRAGRGHRLQARAQLRVLRAELPLVCC